MPRTAALPTEPIQTTAGPDAAAILAAAGETLRVLATLTERCERGELLTLDQLPALTRLQQQLTEEAHARRHHQDIAQMLRRALVDQIARRCAREGWTRIALYGAGRHTRPFVRQPWQWRGVQVVAILDDSPTTQSLGGVPVLRPDALIDHIDAVIVSSDQHEAAIAQAAQRRFAPMGVPVLTIYSDPDAGGLEDGDPDELTRRLIAEYGLPPADAAWLMHNRGERHDATLPMLPPERTELHLRRYEFAARYAAGARALDAAGGTGYGAHVLVEHGGASQVVAVELDPAASAYAARRHGGSGRIEFRCGDATATGLPERSFDLITSFETVEHIEDADGLLAEFARLLAPGGKLIISTPNKAGPTPHHVHDFDRESFQRLLMRRFLKLEWWGQRAGDEPRSGDLPPGIFPLNHAPNDAQYFVVIAAAPKSRQRGENAGAYDDHYTEWEHIHQPFELKFHQGEGQWRWTPQWDAQQQKLFGDRWGFDRDALKGEWTLDIGAGPRFRTEWFRGARLVGVEPLADQYRALNHGAYEHPDVMEVHAAPAEQFLPQLEGRFAFALCHNVLDHCYNWRAVIANAARYLKPGGNFVLSTDVGKHDAEGHPGIESEAALLDALRSAGFEIERTIRRSDASPHWERTITLFLRKN